MSKWVRVTTVIDLKVDEGENLPGILNGLTEGLMAADPDVSRVISLEAHEVEDAPKKSPTDVGRLTFNANAPSCPCQVVIG